jgi:hypothetical protein
MKRKQTEPIPTPSQSSETVEPHVFISYSRKNADFANRLISTLEARHLKIWIDKEGLKPGTRDWEQALRKAIHESRGVLLIASEASCQSLYVRDELAIADAESKSIYPIWAAGEVWINCIPLGRGHMQFIDARGAAYDTAVQAIVEVFDGQTAIEHPPPSTDEAKRLRNPYKGLRAFHSEDRADFFGRELLINQLLETLRGFDPEARLLALVGPSGSGKSSVMMAGLLPALQNGALDDSAEWVYLDPIVPGVHPVENLTAALAAMLPQRSQTSIREDLDQKSARGLHLLARQIVGSKAVRLVLYVDQFEELFTLTTDEAERQQFIDLLTTAATEMDGLVTILLTLRADFYDRPMLYAELGNLIGANTVPVLPMSLADLQEAVQKPALNVGLQFDDGLVSELIFEVRDQAGALPLLQFTLDQLYEQRDESRLTMNAYRAMGGVQGALARHAEAAYDKLPSPEHKALARILLLRLIEPGNTEQETARRRAATAELTLADDAQTALLRDVAADFVRARLLVTNRIGSEETIEVSHEALIREWKRLHEWVGEARDDLRFQRKLNTDITRWEQHHRAPEVLYQGVLLVEAETWAARTILSRSEHDFITASQAARDQMEKEQVSRALREQAAAFQRLILDLVKRYLGAALGTGIVFGVIGYITYHQLPFESTWEFKLNRMRNMLTLAIQYGILMGFPILVAAEIPVRLRTLPHFGRFGLGWLGGAALSALIIVLFYLNQFVNQLGIADLRSMTVLAAPLMFTAGFALASALTQRSNIRWLAALVGIFFAIWQPSESVVYPLFSGVFDHYQGAWYMLRFGLFAAFIISTFTFWPELARSAVIFSRRRALNQ